METSLRHRVLTSVAAGALVGVLAATGMAAATTGEVASSTGEGTSGCGTADVQSQHTWWGRQHNAAR